MPGNLLTRLGRLTGVIDFGELGVGDPACDLIPGWYLFGGDTRELFRAAADVDDTTWARGRGWALCLGLGAEHYYRIRAGFKEVPLGIIMNAVGTAQPPSRARPCADAKGKYKRTDRFQNGRLVLFDGPALGGGPVLPARLR